MKRTYITPARHSSEHHVFGPPEEPIEDVEDGMWCDARWDADEPVIFHRTVERYGLPLREDWICMVCGMTSSEENWQ